MLRQQLRDALHCWQAWARQHHAVATLRAKLKAQLLLRILHFWREWAGMHHALRHKGVLCWQQHEAAVKRRVVVSWQQVALSLTCRRAWHSLAAKWRRSLLLSRALRVWIRCVRQMQVHTYIQNQLCRWHLCTRLEAHKSPKSSCQVVCGSVGSSLLGRTSSAYHSCFQSLCESMNDMQEQNDRCR